MIKIFEAINNLGLSLVIENDTVHVRWEHQDFLYFELEALTKQSDLKDNILERIDLALQTEQDYEHKRMLNNLKESL